MTTQAKPLPPVTIVIEWENAIDVEDKWTRAAMTALERELAAVGPKMAEKPRIMYLYDKGAVPAGTIEKALETTAPRLRQLADLEIIPTEGLTYYKLKNFGIGRSRTDISIMLDSDAAPQPGWLENLNVGDPIWVEYGRGRMPDFPFGVDTVYDIVPVDFVAHAILAILPRVAESNEIGYYTVGSGALNPITGAEIYELTHDYFTRHPMHDRHGRPIAPRRLTFPTHERFREMYADQAGRSATRTVKLTR